MTNPNRFPEKHTGRKERQKRLAVLEARLPKTKRGKGIYRAERVVTPNSAGDDEVFEDALEHMLISATLERDQRAPHNVLAAISWARGVFHSHNFPSRCRVFYCNERNQWMIARIDRRALESHYGRLTGFMSIYDALRFGFIPGAEEGSDLFVANNILRLFRQMQRRRRSMASASRHGGPSKLSVPDAEPFNFELTNLVCESFEMGLAWGEAAIRMEIEEEALAKRAETIVNKERSKKGGEVNSERWQIRRERFYAHLDNCSLQPWWRKSREALRRRKAIAMFRQKVTDDRDLAKLFDIKVSDTWFRDRFEDWCSEPTETPQNFDF
jgi:hypothetical protein